VTGIYLLLKRAFLEKSEHQVNFVELKKTEDDLSGLLQQEGNTYSLYIKVVRANRFRANHFRELGTFERGPN
jgi:hypothetical protein